MFCGNCGSKSEGTSRFCVTCGTPMEGSAPPARPVAPPPPPQPPPQRAYAPPPPPPMAPPPAYRPPQQAAYTPPPPYTPPAPQYPPPQPQYPMPPQPQYSTPPQPQYAPPQQQAWTAPPTYQQPGQLPAYGAPPPMAGNFPTPPSLHWALVLILSAFTGLFGLIWLAMQLNFVRSIDPANKSRTKILFSILAAVAYVILFMMGGAAVASGSSESGMALMGLGAVMLLVSMVFSVMAIFGMRASLVRHYNTAEPMGLRLSGVMTFFFNILYFQYHLTRIARWKQTGVLD